jgi:predicted flavoprotein YhiN
MAKFGKNGRFMSHALEVFNATDLRDFFAKIGVETIARDGFKVYSKSILVHNVYIHYIGNFMVEQII